MAIMCAQLRRVCAVIQVPLLDVKKTRGLAQLRRDTYARLTATQRLQVARHANRPTFLDIALNITDKFVELHGDRAGLDDPAIVCGLGSIDGISFMLIGHQKGRNTKARPAFVMDHSQCPEQGPGLPISGRLGRTHRSRVALAALW